MSLSTHTMEHTTFDFTPSFKNPDDMPEYVSIYERPRGKKGRPKTSTLTEEEKAQRYRDASKRYYYRNIEKERERKLLAYHSNKSR